MMPTFIGAGPARCGTTSVYYYLRQHPQVFMSPTKETNFFIYLAAEQQSRLRGARMGFPARSLDQYQELFRNANTALARGEISPSYFWVPDVPRLIQRYLPDARLIFILRHPLQRAYSSYFRLRVDGIETRAFETAVEEELSNPRDTPLSGRNYYIRSSLYAANLERFSEYFPPSQFKVMFFEDLKTAPAAFMRSIFEFIGVRGDQEVDTSVQFNGAGTVMADRFLKVLGLKSVSRLLHRLPPRLFHPMYRTYSRLAARPGGEPELSSALRGHLSALFGPDIMRLQALTGRDLSDWLAN
jgi:hypothetical protein